MAKVTGEGSIVQMEKGKTRARCRTWQLRVPIGKDPRTGKYRQRTKVFHGTYTEAKKALRDFIDKVEGDHVQGQTDWTFESYCGHYIDVRRANGSLSETTIRRMDVQLRSASRHIGKVKLERIDTPMLDEMVSAMLRGDTKSGRPLSGTYVRQTCGMVNLVLQHAVDEGILVENPCTGVTKPKKDTRWKDALPTERVKSFVMGLDPTDSHELAYLLAVTMGLRRGEICGLSWEDIDWARRSLYVRHNLDTLGNLKEPKSAAGRRILPIPDITYEGLRKAKEAQRKEFERISCRRATRGDSKLGPLEQTESTAVITNYVGKRITTGGLEGWWVHERASYGFAGYQLHGLRHTYLSILAEEGVHPKVMQVLAGHASSRTTMDIYTHVNLRSKEVAVETFSTLFAPRDGSPGEGEG